MPNTIKPENTDSTQRHAKETCLDPHCLDDACQDNEEIAMFSSVEDNLFIIACAALTTLFLAAIVKVFGA